MLGRTLVGGIGSADCLTIRGGSENCPFFVSSLGFLWRRVAGLDRPMGSEYADLRTLVLGLGNPICGDDGVGIRVAEALKDRVCGSETDVAQTTAAGLGLLDLIGGYQRIIVIDAIQTCDGKAGQVYRLGLDDLPSPLHCATLHDVDLATALELGRRLGMEMPREVVIFAVEVADTTTFREECTPEVARAIPKVIHTVLQELKSTQ